jgi:hypothetical protein
MLADVAAGFSLTPDYDEKRMAHKRNPVKRHHKLHPARPACFSWQHRNVTGTLIVRIACKADPRRRLAALRDLAP